jgi:hypothetical protein
MITPRGEENVCASADRRAGCLVECSPSAAKAQIIGGVNSKKAMQRWILHFILKNAMIKIGSL